MDYVIEVLDEYIRAEDVENYLDFLCKPGIKPGGDCWDITYFIR